MQLLMGKLRCHDPELHSGYVLSALRFSLIYVKLVTLNGSAAASALCRCHCACTSVVGNQVCHGVPSKKALRYNPPESNTSVGLFRCCCENLHPEVVGHPVPMNTGSFTVPIVGTVSEIYSKPFPLTASAAN